MHQARACPVVVDLEPHRRHRLGDELLHLGAELDDEAAERTRRFHALPEQDDGPIRELEGLERGVGWHLDLGGPCPHRRLGGRLDVVGHVGRQGPREPAHRRHAGRAPQAEPAVADLEVLVARRLAAPADDIESEHQRSSACHRPPRTCWMMSTNSCTWRAWTPWSCGSNARLLSPISDPPV